MIIYLRQLLDRQLDSTRGGRWRSKYIMGWGGEIEINHSIFEGDSRTFVNSLPKGGMLSLAISHLVRDTC